MMGTGKSKIGELLATKLDLNFLDLDTKLEELFGKTINKVFSEFGEETFRQTETRELLNLKNNLIVSENNFILSTGGGIILKNENRQILKSLGYIIWLKASSQTIYARIKDDLSRPLLLDENRQQHKQNGKEKLHKIQKLLNDRESLYAEIADLAIETDYLEPKQIIEIIIKTYFSPF